jgi:hypothetical protein
MVQPGEELLPRSPFLHASLFVFARFYGCKSPAVRKRKHYAIAPRQKENSVVSIGYIPRAVIRCNLERDILTFFDIMVYICDRFVFTTSGTGRKFVEPFYPLGINSDEGSILPRSAESFLSSPPTAVCRYLLV